MNRKKPAEPFPDRVLSFLRARSLRDAMRVSLALSLLLTVALFLGPVTEASSLPRYSGSAQTVTAPPVGVPITLGATRESDRFVVHSASPDSAERTLSLAENAWSLLSTHFDVLPVEPITIVVVEDAAEYKRIQPATMTRGFATFGGNRIYLRGSDLDQEVVTHEVAHIILGKNVRPGLDIPDWFNEGFAQFVSRGDQHSREIFYLVATGKLLPLPELDHVDALHGPNREFPTVQGLAVVQFLVHEYGQDKLWDLVSSLSHSRTFSQALLDTYGRSDLELSDQWLAYAGNEYGILSTIGLETAGTAALGLLALLAILVWVSSKLRLRPSRSSANDLSEWEVGRAESAAALLDAAAERTNDESGDDSGDDSGDGDSDRRWR